MECLRTTSHKSNIAKEIIQINLVKASCIEFDNNPNLLGFKTKKLDLTTGDFSNIEYKDYITMSTGYDYVEPTSDQTKKIEDLFNQVFPNEEIKKSFLSILYNCLIGGQKEKFIIARGEGGNGKGVIMELVKVMLGDYAYTAPVSLITKEMRGGANPEIANLHRKRLAIYKEPAATDKLWLSNVKQLTGNDEINARGLYSGITKCKLECTNILETNHSLNFNGTSGDAEMRRFIEIMFESTFTDDKTMLNDPTLENVYKKDDYFITSSFREEYKCVLLRYILDNADKKIYIPDCVKQQTSQYIDNQNSFKFWLEDNYELTQEDTDVVKVKDMFNLYMTSEEYRNTNREHRPNLHKFTLDFVRSDKKLKNKYRDEYRPQNNGVRLKMRSVIIGIKLKEEEIDD
jgi:P4 family phage/plasmid primase-like protien